MKTEKAQRPVLRFEAMAQDNPFERAFLAALENLMDINTLEFDPAVYNKTGLLEVPGCFVRAGGDYPTPWTRDAAVNSWNAASLLSPVEARNTLLAVCERTADGRLIIQQDNQWWDQILWVTGAWAHFMVTGDEAFLEHAYEAGMTTLSVLTRERYDDEFGLFQGPSALSDGIAGFPRDMYDKESGSSFVLDHRGCDKMMTLSTNCIYHHALLRLADMAGLLGEDDVVLRVRAKALRESIQKAFWVETEGRFGYVVYGAGPRRGELDASQEGIGLAYAMLFDVATPEQCARILKNAKVHPFGIVNVTPHFEGFSDDHLGRHNVLVWPPINGMWADAAAKHGRADIFAHEMTSLAELVQKSKYEFFEIYHPFTGEVDGGYQLGGGKEIHWRSCGNQTWSATAYLRMVFHSLFGMVFEKEKLAFRPVLPKGFGPVRLSGIKWRGITFDVVLIGEGGKVSKCVVDGTEAAPEFLPAMTGHHTLELTLSE